MKSLSLYIIVYLAGCFIFAIRAAFRLPFWEDIFFIWQSIAEASFLGWFAIYHNVDRSVQRSIRWLLWFSGIKVVGEFVVAKYKWDINNEVAVAVVFIILVFGTGFMVFREGAKANKFLSKHLNV